LKEPDDIIPKTQLMLGLVPIMKKLKHVKYPDEMICFAASRYRQSQNTVKINTHSRLIKIEVSNSRPSILTFPFTQAMLRQMGKRYLLGKKKKGSC